MADPIACPRCHGPTSAELHTVPATGSRLEVDICRACRGVWLDGDEVAQAFRELGDHLGVLRETLLSASAGARTSGVGTCPRCGSDTVDLPYLGVALDVCSLCYGVWIDGDELEALARTADRAAGRAAPEPPGGERAVAAAIADDHVACTACGTVVPLRRTLLTGRGVMCDACGERANAEPSELTAEERSRLVDETDVMEDELRRSAERRSTVVAVFRAIGTVLGLLLAGNRCPHCSCSRHSHCSH
ncbi:MAG: zf-TFIIB domain-containing protein [Polyangiaceae bacterium]|nr:zf-TFIIB domain-containing protein [Polyangiaceae bacterium]